MIELLSADNTFLLKCPESGQSRIRQSAVLLEIDLVQSAVFDSSFCKLSKWIKIIIIDSMCNFCWNNNSLKRGNNKIFQLV